MFKKSVSLVIVLAMVLCSFAMAEGIAAQDIALGTSGLTMKADASYVKGEISAEDTDENQVAYYKSDVIAVDFDIYQWVKAEGETLESTAIAEAAEYGSECVAAEINGIPAYYYEAVEESEGAEYTTLTYILENGDVLAEIVFWMDGENADVYVAAMVDSITAAYEAEITDEGNVITLGTSTLKITLPCVYVKGEISAEDTDENQVAYYASEECSVDFDVYQWAKAAEETLADAAAEEAAEFEAEVGTTEINGIQIAYYNAVEESEGASYNTVTFIMEDGNDFVELVFWLDGENATEIVDAIIGSIAR